MIEISKTIFLGGSVVSAYRGGLVLGPRHYQGGIKMFMYNGKGGYEYFSEMEGGEYILNPAAVKLYKTRLEFINSHFGECSDIRSRKASNIRHLDLSNKNDILIICDTTQFIVNRFATKKYLKELNKMNESTILDVEADLNECAAKIIMQQK